MIPPELLNTVTIGDARELAGRLPDESIDLIFTDPPYPRAFFHCYEALAGFAPRVLRRGASLVTILPAYNLPEIVALFAGRLKWRWLLAMNQTEGSHPRMAMGIEVCHKPMGWWVKEAYPHGRGFVRDQVDIPAPDKSLHPWQQDLAWCLYYVEKFTRPGAVVLDPFCGSGTVGEACLRLGRQFVAFDVDPAAVETARRRLGEISAALAVMEAMPA